MPKEILGRTMYTVQEVADMLGVQPRTVRDYIRLGRLKGAKFNKRWNLTHEELTDFITGAAGTVKANDALRPMLADNPKVSEVFNSMTDEMRLVLNAWAKMDDTQRAILEKEIEPKKDK